jgi:hypothetical protein
MHGSVPTTGAAAAESIIIIIIISSRKESDKSSRVSIAGNQGFCIRRKVAVGTRVKRKRWVIEGGGGG